MAPYNAGITQILNNASATSGQFGWPGGEGVFRAKATWNGGSVKLQMLGPDGVSWMDVGTDTSLTSDGGGAFRLPMCQLRVAVTTATAVYADIGGY